MNLKLGIKNYRSIGSKGLEVEFKPLTFLTGDNCSGKSSFIHPLVLLYQSYKCGLLPDRSLMLNGRLLKPTLLDVLNPSDGYNWIRNRWTRSNSIEFTLTIDDENYRWEFEAQPGMGLLPLLSPPVDRFPIDKLQYFHGKDASSPIDCIDVIGNALPGTVLLLELPDAFLDGNMLRSMAGSITGAIARGVTVIVESHDLHLFNGIRTEIVRDRIDCEDISFLYCRSVDRHLQVRPLSVDRDGRFPEWLQGFFDRLELDLDEILRGRECK